MAIEERSPESKSSTPERFVCTADNPWKPGDGRALHPDAEYLDDTDWGGGEVTADYKCPHCGKFFREELAQ